MAKVAASRERTSVSALFTVVALGPVTCETNSTGSQLTAVKIKVIISKFLPVSYTETTLIIDAVFLIQTRIISQGISVLFYQRINF